MNDVEPAIETQTSGLEDQRVDPVGVNWLDRDVDKWSAGRRIYLQAEYNVAFIGNVKDRANLRYVCRVLSMINEKRLERNLAVTHNIWL